MAHKSVEPAILYFGTPVVLVTSLNEDGTPNVAPMSSAWWLGWNCMLGLGARSKTPQNILRTRECVLNLPSADLVPAVDRLARLTASNPVPPHKLAMGYRYEADKFGFAGLTATASELVGPPRVAECPVQLEAVLTEARSVGAGDPSRPSTLVAIEVRIVRVHIEEGLLMEGHQNRVDPVKWRPLIMSFCQFFGLGGDMLQHSRLAEIPESAYRPPSATSSEKPVGPADPASLARPDSEARRSFPR
jgi:flavin reductase (DIM6/NTAB) family NADH-FMN oxidoreductase RutF